jgi:DDE domain
MGPAIARLNTMCGVDAIGIKPALRKRCTLPQQVATDGVREAVGSACLTRRCRPYTRVSSMPANASAWWAKLWRAPEQGCVRVLFFLIMGNGDKRGKTVDFLLRPDRGIAAAQAFFRKALSTSLPRWPRKITLDGHVPSHLALRLLRREDRNGSMSR